MDYKPSSEFIENIKKTAKKQRVFISSHKYNLEKFGLTERKIIEDCSISKKSLKYIRTNTLTIEIKPILNDSKKSKPKLLTIYYSVIHHN